MEKQIKSKERVKELGEVYTNEKEINKMLDLIPIENDLQQINYKYLEPACGNGNFLVKILERKLNAISKLNLINEQDKLQYILKSIATIYGIDIDTENTTESKDRLFNMLNEYAISNNIDISTITDTVKYILDKNILIGNTLSIDSELTISDFIFNDTEIKELVYYFNEVGNSTQPFKTYIFTDYKILSKQNLN